MVSTIRVDDNVKQKLKIRSVELGVTQYDLVNRYILKGLAEEIPEDKQPPTIDEIKQMLEHDKPEGNGFKDFNDFIETDEVTDAVELKRNAFE